MAFEKATITPEGGETIEVRFNPTQYSIEASNEIAENKILGLSAPILQYVSGNTRILSMDLLFDTYEQGIDVRKAYTNKIYKLLDLVPSTHKPPICTFAWKDMIFTCLLERINGRFTMFLENGTPVRATLTVTFKEYRSVDDLVRNPPLESADHTKTYTVKLGDTLSSIAAAEYGTPAQWRPIANANGIDNPRTLTPGRVLVIPPLI